MLTSAPCPNCAATLKLPDHAFGKPVTCPKCAARVTVPTPGEFEVVDDAGFEEVPAEPRAPARARPVRARPVAPAFDEADADDEPDDRPRRRGSRAPAAKRGVPRWAFAAGGGALVLLLLLGVVGVWLSGALSGWNDPTPPPGYSVARSSAGGYRVFLPGPVQEVKFFTGPLEAKVADNKSRGHRGSGAGGDAEAAVTSRLVPAGFNPGTSESELLGQLKAAGGWRYDAKWYTKPEVRPVTIGGRPGLEVRVKDKPDWMDEGRAEAPDAPTGNAAFDRSVRESRAASEKMRKDMAARRALDAKSTVILFTTDGKRTYLIELTKKGDYVDAATVQTVLDSFTFL